MQEINERFKKMRADQTMLHTTSKKGMARLEAEMVKENSDPTSQIC